MGVSEFYRYQQYERPEVKLPTVDERLAAQARKATRFLNSRFIRPIVEAVTIEVVTDAYVGQKAVAWKYQRPGAGRPRICRDIEEAIHWQMDVFGCGKISPVFPKEA